MRGQKKEIRRMYTRLSNTYTSNDVSYIDINRLRLEYFYLKNTKWKKDC